MPNPRVESRLSVRIAVWTAVVAVLTSPAVPSAAFAFEGTAPASAPPRGVAATEEAPEDTPATPVVSIIGTPRVGVELSIDPGVWPEGVTFDYQWRVGDLDIEGATSATFTPRVGDQRKTVTVTLTGTGSDFPATSAMSAPTEAVDLGRLTPSSRPVISGTVQVGGSVTASRVWWTPGAITSYSWRIGGDSVWSGGAYTLRPADAGKTLVVVVSGITPGYYATSIASAPVTVAYAELTAPTPTISGFARLDEVLTVVPGAWTPGTVLRYQWSVGGSPVAGATGTTYEVRPADADKTVTVAVTGSKYGYAPVTTTSAPTPPVAFGTLTSPQPKVGGTARVGATLTATVGRWTEGAVLSYQWLLDGRPQAGATGTRLTLQPSDRGKRVSFAVTGSLRGHKATRVISVASAPVAPGRLVSAAPLIRGSAKHGVTLVAKPGVWSAGTSLTYRWYVGGKAVPGATTTRFTPTRAHVGKTVRVKVTGKKPGYTTITRTSTATKTVAKLSVFRLKTPDITGTPRVGHELLVSTNFWVPEIRYQWYVGGTKVTGATGDTFVPRAAHRGKTVTCKVTIRKPGYVTVTKASLRTAPVR